MEYLPPPIPIPIIQMANDELKVAWSPVKKSTQNNIPPLKNWQKQHLRKYQEMKGAGMLTEEQFKKYMTRHKIHPSYW